MVDINKQTPAKGTSTGATEADSSFGLSGDGMSTATARLAIDRKIRKELLEDYDLLELENKGRYYAAKACTKDGHWLTELSQRREGYLQTGLFDHQKRSF